MKGEKKMEDVNKIFPHIAGYEAIKEECAQARKYRGFSFG